MKRIIVAMIWCFCAFVAEAQFSFGVKAGVNQNSVRGDRDPFRIESSTGFHIGAYGSFPLFKKLSLNPELQYIRKQSVAFGRNQNYLEVPILFNYQISNRFVLELGPAIGQEIYTRRTTSGRRAITVRLYDTSLDFGMIGGVKYKASNRISIAARYNYSFLPFDEIMFNNGPAYFIETYRFYSQNVQLSVMYRIK